MSEKVQVPRVASKCKRHPKPNQKVETEESLHTSQLLQEVAILQKQLDNFKTAKSVREKELMAEHSKAITKLKATYDAQMQATSAQLQKAKKTAARFENINLGLVKKINLLEGRLAEGQKRVSVASNLKQSSKQLPKPRSAKAKVVQHASDQNKYVQNRKSSDEYSPNTHYFQLQVRNLREQNSSLHARIKILESERSSAQNVFEPLLRQSSEQVRTLIHDKNKLIVQNAQLASQVAKLAADANHFEKTYKAMQANFTKLQRQFLVPTAQKEQPDNASLKTNEEWIYRVEAKCKDLQSRNNEIQEQVIDLQATKANLEQYVRHLENTNRYLANQNKKLVGLRQHSSQP